MQSMHARESQIPTNGDGFGVGWYMPEISATPAIFTSVLPAWNDRNLLHLTAKIESPTFFAHVRAASSGGVTQYNCHPFIHGDWMLMHNGGIYDFMTIKRHLRHLLDDDIYNWILGETDSEHLFALFLQLAKGKDLGQLANVAEVLQNTIQQINALVMEYCPNPGASYFNICLTDGKRMVATRYCSMTDIIPESLHYITESSLVSRAHRREKKHESETDFVLVASEKLNNFRKDWYDVPVNHLILIDEKQKIQLCPML